MPGTEMHQNKSLGLVPFPNRSISIIFTAKKRTALGKHKMKIILLGRTRRGQYKANARGQYTTGTG